MCIAFRVYIVELYIYSGFLYRRCTSRALCGRELSRKIFIEPPIREVIACVTLSPRTSKSLYVRLSREIPSLYAGKLTLF